jgi:ubiquinone/menaquinone biosynthesis C-methylase UbiE
MLGGGEDAHVGAELGDEDLSGALAHTPIGPRRASEHCSARARIGRRLGKEPHTMKLNFREVYTNLLNRVKTTKPDDMEAAKLTVGGHFEMFGTLERELLIQKGLRRDHYLIDVGCGSGRLTRALVPYLTGRYLGIDVVPELLAYARTYAKGHNWRFELAEGLRIPEDDGSADMVCFFSVFTHLLHEQSYVYLSEAKRVLKPGGKIVFSFTEFCCPSHWPVFEMAVAEIGLDLPLYVFIAREAIEVWAAHLALTIETIQGGEERYIELPHPVFSDDGTPPGFEGTLGQSVCVLMKRS